MDIISNILVGGLFLAQKLIQKQKSKEKEEPKQEASVRLALRALQKQLEVVRLREYLLMSGFAVGGAVLRVPMQAVPSAEPLSFFALLSGWLFGKKKGFLVGAGSLYLSNFMVFGGQGPWTVAQAFAFGVVGFLGGFLRKKSTVIEVITVTIIATIVWEIMMNVASSLLFGFNILLAFASAVPFTLMHLASNTGFAFLLKPARALVLTKGGLHEKEVCKGLIARIKRRLHS